MFSHQDFHQNSFGVWKPCTLPAKLQRRGPDFESVDNYTLKRTDQKYKFITSAYYYGSDVKGGDYIIRVSDHWSRILYNNKAVTNKRYNQDYKEYLEGYANLPDHLFGLKQIGNIRSCFWVLSIKESKNTAASLLYGVDLDSKRSVSYQDIDKSVRKFWTKQRKHASTIAAKIYVKDLKENRNN